MSFRVVAFTREWKFKGYVNPTLQNDYSVWFIHVEEVVQFIKDKRPEGEVWLIEIKESKA